LGSEVAEYKYLDAKPVGKDFVVFKLEDGAKVVVGIDIGKVGVRKGKDGKPLGKPEDYFVDAQITKVKVIPSPRHRTFKVTTQAEEIAQSQHSSGDTRDYVG